MRQSLVEAERENMHCKNKLRLKIQEEGMGTSRIVEALKAHNLKLQVSLTLLVRSFTCVLADAYTSLWVC